MKLSEYKNEKAIEILADIIEPVTEIMGDKNISKLMKDKTKLSTLASAIMKNHSKAVFQILATLEEKSVEEYECNIFSVPAKLIELLNDAELMNFFGLQSMTASSTPSGSASVNTKVKKK